MQAKCKSLEMDIAALRMDPSAQQNSTSEQAALLEKFIVSSHKAEQALHMTKAAAAGQEHELQRCVRECHALK
jgi:hypothetical protein